MVDYMERVRRRAASRGRTSSRHMLGLRNGQPGARRWRQVWSDHGLKSEPARTVSRLARAAMAAQARTRDASFAA